MPRRDLREYLAILRKRLLLVGGCWILVVGAVTALSLAATPVYEAEGKLFVGQRPAPSADVTEARNITELSLQLIKSYAAIVRTRPVAESAKDVGDLPQSPSEIASKLRVDPILDTQLIQLRYRSSSAQLAQRTVDAVAKAFVDSIGRIEAPIAQGQTPAPVIRVSVVEPATEPSTPVTPNIPLNIALAVVLGLGIGIAIALLGEYLDTRVKNREEAETAAGSPVLATLPKIRVRKREVYIEGDNQSPIAETYRKLRTAIQLYGVDTPIQVVLVTSPLAAEGKTTVAANIAATYAYAGINTLLMECDLRRPRIHQVFRPEGMTGLTTALLEQTPIAQSVMGTDIRNLYCLPAAAIPPNPVDLLGSRQMAEVITDLRRQFRAIIIDSPPILPVADTTTLVPRVDGVLLVAWAKETRRDRLADAALQVEKAGGRLMGVILNASDEQGGSDYYSYYAARRA
jgi:polysaccharide biosynthesis transport protein